MQPISVLLVDDNTTFLNILKSYLQERQWEKTLRVIGTANCGEDALKKASGLKPDVVLLDLVMPGMSGFQVIPRLKQALPQVQIIVLTLLDSPDYRQTSLAAGADFFVAKENLDIDLKPAFAKIVQQGGPLSAQLA
jgi:DNA-binding NarL/FixJ family response regulator